MRPPRTLQAALIGLSALALSPAAIADEQVEIQIDMTAPTAEIYNSIQEQAWDLCASEQQSHFVSARLNARRACQKALIKDVLAQLPETELPRFAGSEQSISNR
ncbi:MAG: hypothetical protein AAFR51_00505 [Pseudomonadota bacterium]